MFNIIATEINSNLSKYINSIAFTERLSEKKCLRSKFALFRTACSQICRIIERRLAEHFIKTGVKDPVSQSVSQSPPGTLLKLFSPRQQYSPPSDGSPRSLLAIPRFVFLSFASQNWFSALLQSSTCHTRVIYILPHSGPSVPFTNTDKCIIYSCSIQHHIHRFNITILLMWVHTDLDKLDCRN